MRFMALMIASIQEEFMAYVACSKKDHIELQPEFKAAIELMHLLNLAGASLTLYEKLFDWHIEYLGATKKVEHC